MSDKKKEGRPAVYGILDEGIPSSTHYDRKKRQIHVQQVLIVTETCLRQLLLNRKGDLYQQPQYTLMRLRGILTKAK